MWSDNATPQRILGMLARLHNAKIFKKIDMRNAYRFVGIKEGNKWKNAFCCRYGHYEYRDRYFGLSNAPACFHHFMTDIVRDCLDMFALNNLNGICIYWNDLMTCSSSPILGQLRTNNLYAKVKKREFHTDNITFLGFHISPAGVGMDQTQIAAVLDWPTPSTDKELHRRRTV